MMVDLGRLPHRTRKLDRVRIVIHGRRHETPRRYGRVSGAFPCCRRVYAYRVATTETSTRHPAGVDRQISAMVVSFATSCATTFCVAVRRRCFRWGLWERWLLTTTLNHFVDCGQACDHDPDRAFACRPNANPIERHCCPEFISWVSHDTVGKIKCDRASQPDQGNH